MVCLNRVEVFGVVMLSDAGQKTENVVWTPREPRIH